MSSIVQPPQHMMYGATLAEHQAEQWANAYQSSRGGKKHFILVAAENPRIILYLCSKEYLHM
jgi:hypothetical protein